MSESKPEAIVLPLSKECPVMNTIASYQAVPYQQGDNDGAFIIRLVELNTFLKNKTLFSNFTKATGYLAPYHYFTPDELVLLLNKASEIMKRLNDKGNELKNAINSIEAAKNTNKVGDYHQLLAIADNLAYKKRRAEDNLNDFQTKEAAVYSMMSLLNPWINNFKAACVDELKSHQQLISQIARFQEMRHAPEIIPNQSQAFDNLAKLTGAINTVVDALKDLPFKSSPFRVVHDRVPPNPNDVIRLEARRLYYRPEGERYRDLMTVEAFEKNALKEQDIAAMPQNMLDARRRLGNGSLSF